MLINEKSRTGGSSETLIAFYNVENLFLPDPPPRHHLDPTASGMRNWDEQKYQNKLRKTAHVFRLMQEEYGSLPAMIGLCEVQGRDPLEDLAALAPFNDRFGIVHFNSMDERGVDVALLYDKDKVEVLSAEPISYFFTVQAKDYEYYDTTRDVLFCRVRIAGTVINLFVVHLPSKREKNVNQSRRHYILVDLHEKIVKLHQTSDEPVIICGDFNENPDEKVITDFLYDDQLQKILFNPFAELFPQGIYSTFHYKSGLLFDQMLLSLHFRDKNFPLCFGEAAVFSHEMLQARTKGSSVRPFRTYSGTRYLGGYSDHFPIICKLGSKK